MSIIRTDILVVGSGVTGLLMALDLSASGNVLLVTKNQLKESNTEYAQGGIAAAINPDDNPRIHLEDTLRVGDGLCDQKAVQVLVEEGPTRVRRLAELGVNFDRNGEGFATTLEGGHSRKRVLHAKGDATGSEFERALIQQVRSHPNIQVREYLMGVEILMHQNRCRGLLLFDLKEKKVFPVEAKAVVFASGGAGALYKHTTNPAGATGDGMAMACRAGAELMDMEFIQFHPTALKVEGAPRFLISEAVRGEGAYLRNINDQLFMAKYHPKLELAPRDVVSRAIFYEMHETQADHVYLDLTHMATELIERRFPTILKMCQAYGIDIRKDLIPVSPAAHYFMGGIHTDINSRTTLPGLFAAGETACTGVHGANRLASNSLLECVVFGERAVDAVARYLKETPFTPLSEVTVPAYAEQLQESGLRETVRELMWESAGVIRGKQDLERALFAFSSMEKSLKPSLDLEYFEVRNLLEVGKLTLRAALAREESRGAHYRKDFPAKNDELWHKHLVFRGEAMSTREVG